MTGQDVTVTISTRNRYYSTLPLCLVAIANQTITPKKIILFDDGEHKDLREDNLYKNIFTLFNEKKISWEVVFGTGEGQVRNHQFALENKPNSQEPVVSTELIWRLDDDNIPEPNVLETLLSSFSDSTGAVACLVLNSKHGVVKNSLASNKIEDIFLGMNEQWFLFENNETKKVDHLYSTFLFRKKAAFHGYCKELSRVGHREETIFTYEMTRNNWDCLINPNAIVWHFNFESGGIRDNTNEDMWRHDENIFHQKMENWNIKPNDYFFAVLDCGIGDHFSFKTILPEIIEKNKNKKIVLSVCFEDVFYDYQEIKLISIADAKLMFGDIDKWNVYKWLIDHNWKGSLVDAFKNIYLK